MAPELATQLAQETDMELVRQIAIQLAYDNQRLEEEVTKLEAQIIRLQEIQSKLDPVTQAAELAAVKEEVALLKKKLYDRHSERRKGNSDKPTTEKKKQTGHPPNPQLELSTETQDVEIPQSQQICPKCQGALELLGNETEDTEIIDVHVRGFVRRVYRRKKYRCRCNACVVTAPGPVKLQPGGRYSPGFAVEVALSKYAQHLPLERQVWIMKHQGLQIANQTLWDQLDVLATILTPTYEAIMAKLLAETILLVDETRWPLMDNGKMKASHTCYVWCLVGNGFVGYRILDAKSNEAGRLVLLDYHGIVMCDGYKVYQSLAKPQVGQPPSFQLAHCWSHVRRKFVDIETTYPGPIAIVLDHLRALFLLEREIQGVPPEERYQRRQNEAKPLVNAIFTWAEEQDCLPQSSLAKAIGYMQDLKPGLIRFLDDPQIPLSNNLCERMQRGVVLGRVNHYGSRSRRGTQVAAIFYTLIESAKLAGVNLQKYLLTLTEAALREPGTVILPADFAKLTNGEV